MDMRLNKHEKSNWERAILHNPTEVRIKRYGLLRKEPPFFIYFIFFIILLFVSKYILILRSHCQKNVDLRLTYFEV